MSIVCSTQHFQYGTRDLTLIALECRSVYCLLLSLTFFLFVCFGSFFPFVSVPMGYLFLRKATGNAY